LYKYSEFIDATSILIYNFCKNLYGLTESKTFSDRIKWVLKEKTGNNKQKLADSIGMSRTIITAYVNEDSPSIPKADVIAKICSVYNISEKWMLTGKGSPEGSLLTDSQKVDNALIHEKLDMFIETIEHLRSRLTK
jgi:transcriptional regulator with XRE-family HTH domain